MKHKTKFLVAASVLATALSQNANAHLKPKENEEKCYGVVKAGKNQCTSEANKHQCAGQARVDSDPYEWVIVPKGLCEKLVNGSTEPGSAEEDGT